MFTFSVDLVLFFILFVLFVYVFAISTIGSLHKAYLVFHFTMMLWPLLQFAIKTVEDEEVKLVFQQAAFIDGILLVVGWFVFALFLAGQSGLLRRRLSLTIYLPALFGVVGVIVNPRGMFLTSLQGGDIAQHGYGILFWIYIAISLSYLIASLYAIYQTRKSASAPRIVKQVRRVIKGILVLFIFILSDVIFNVVLAQWLPIIPGLTSLGILLSAVFFVIAIRRDKVFNLLTIAHQDIIDTIQYGILVLDDNETVVEINKTLRPEAQWRIGDRFRVEDLLSKAKDEPNKAAFLEAYRTDPMKSSEIELIFGENEHRYILVHVAPIIVESTMIGRSITFQDVSEVRRLLNRLEQLAATDGLTGCYNRYYLTRHLEQEVRKNARYRIPFAFILLDIDWFKRINDQYGHLVGDEVLCSVVSKIQQVLRRTDTLARYGGEEFMIYMPHADSTQASILAERVRSVIELHAITVDSSADSISVTVSLGLVSIGADKVEHKLEPASYVRQLFASVDEALYEAKKGGRNRIVSR